jgi:hypothetical protein
VAAFIACPGKILPYLAFVVTAFHTLIPIPPFEMGQVFLAVFVRFEPIIELQKVLALKKIHETLDFVGFKGMNLSTEF